MAGMGQGFIGQLIDVSDLGVLSLLSGLNTGVVMLEHIVDAVGDPLDMLLDAHHHIGRHRRTARPGDGKKVGKAGDIIGGPLDLPG